MTVIIINIKIKIFSNKPISQCHINNHNHNSNGNKNTKRKALKSLSKSSLKPKVKEFIVENKGGTSHSIHYDECSVWGEELFGVFKSHVDHDIVYCVIYTNFNLMTSSFHHKN